jgi:hypothetical protein
MGVSLAVAQIYVPSSIRKKRLLDLFNSTADAFRYPAPLLSGLTVPEILNRYAIFTCERAKESIQQCQQIEVKKRLFENSLEMGLRLREEFKVAKIEEVMMMGRIVYKILGIDFQGNQNGEILVQRCFFSGYYSPMICRVISSLDQGLMAGLSSGGRLAFSERITEGHQCCRANLLFEDKLQ